MRPTQAQRLIGVGVVFPRQALHGSDEHADLRADILAEFAVGDAKAEGDGVRAGELRVVLAHLRDLLGAVFGFDGAAISACRSRRTMTRPLARRPKDPSPRHNLYLLRLHF
jgi:hypothetical protein